MARVKLSPLLTDISGSIGGVTIQRNKFGVTLRQKPLPLNTLTSARSNIRALMVTVQQAWQNLTATQRLQWERFLDFSGQSINKNRSVKLSGHALYIKYQMYRLISGFPLLTTITYVPMPDVPLVNGMVNYGGYMNLVFYSTVDVSDYFFLIKLSNPRQASRAFSANGLRVCITPYPPSDNASYNIKASYESAFGVSPAAGATIHYSVLWFSVLAPVFTSKSTGTFLST